MSSSSPIDRRLPGWIPAVVLCAAWSALPARSSAQPVAAAPAGNLPPPTELVARDHPSDNGNAIDLAWRLSAADVTVADRQARIVRSYEIRRELLDAAQTGEELIELFRIPYGVDSYVDRKCRRGARYTYQICAVDAEGRLSAPTATAEPAVAVRQWFDSSRTGFAVILALVCGAVIYFTERTKAGKSLHIREIAALRAMREAVGRATEMGRPCLFVTGMEDMNEIATVAGVAILEHIARLAAEYDADLIAPTARSLVMTAAGEAVQGAYLAAGRPESFNPDRIYYVSDEQFAFVAHLTGLMVRERPAACFYAGIFYAESLILAETGNSVGAIQIAGTSEAVQLPFFVAGCDYTLLGEELFAASAYLTGEPQQIGSLKGQDAGKILAGVVLLFGCALATAAQLAPEWSFASSALEFLRQVCLGGGSSG